MSSFQAPAYLVQGFFFQHREYLGIGMRPGEGAVALIKSGVFRDMFAGMIHREEWLFGDWAGQLSDPVGQSVLTNVRLDDSRFSFDKQYDRRSDIIHYTFSPAPEGNFWVGGYEGDLVGKGSANCILTPIPEQLLQFT